MTDPIDELAVRVLNEHLLAGPRPGQCRCGWGDGSDVRTLGRSHSKHVLEQLRAAGTLADAQRPDTSDDDLFTDLDAW